MRKTWHTRREGPTLIHARTWPVRWDIAVAQGFPALDARRLARAIRQDLWRALQGLRGFCPAVQVSAAPDGVTVVAGGQVAAVVFPRAWAEAEIAALLSDPVRRGRWIAWAGRP